MTLLDVRVVYYSYLIVMLLCVITMVQLWLQYRRDFPGIEFWTANFTLHFTGILLIVLRGSIPDWISIVVANLIIVFGAVLLYEGLGRYLGVTVNQRLNLLVLIVFLLGHIYFTYSIPDSAFRVANQSAAIIVITLQCANLLLFRSPVNLRKAARSAGIVFLLFAMVSVFQFVVNAFLNPVDIRIVTGNTGIFALFMYQILHLALTFSLYIMVVGTLSRKLETELVLRKEAEEELQKNRRFLLDIIENSGNLITVKDQEGQYQLVNKKWEEVSGISRRDAQGKTDLDIFPEEIALQFRVHDQLVMDLGIPRELEEFLDTSFGRRHLLATKFPVWNEEEQLTGVCSMAMEITQRKEDEERIRFLATHDHLTGLMGMQPAKERIILAMGLGSRLGKKVAILFMDLDGFKRVNDTLGHLTGDLVLKEVANRLSSAVRETDTVARVGGDEFLVALSGIQDETVAWETGNKILLALQAPMFIEGTEIGIGASVGIAIYPDHGEKLEELLLVADRTMYEAKKAGKNQVLVARGNRS